MIIKKLIELILSPQLGFDCCFTGSIYKMCLNTYIVNSAVLQPSITDHREQEADSTEVELALAWQLERPFKMYLCCFS